MKKTSKDNLKAICTDSNCFIINRRIVNTEDTVMSLKALIAFIKHLNFLS